MTSGQHTSNPQRPTSCPCKPLIPSRRTTWCLSHSRPRPLKHIYPPCSRHHTTQRSRPACLQTKSGNCTNRNRPPHNRNSSNKHNHTRHLIRRSSSSNCSSCNSIYNSNNSTGVRQLAMATEGEAPGWERRPRQAAVGIRNTT